mmetsp:Transcript_40214/g.45765  ORF Transcript_40214/g.45765 Transcript_40214/m.45765 type:complete len:171 (-) Transcript_40214:118-630(-)|eukprot:CAMPEP_0194190690 /NCGR_PEP_ID=MMETSP0154-20130528/63850_1 /TAXON_ID=1049557 /ORGANISM="Thalassiothrix antarctica, Strain L6-D1" /LENGTH=170 /DNA_ID=CAMNT_0038912773 /DNA_START=75 /DNA_END=590 /DNA_ORIENTATION=+
MSWKVRGTKKGNLPVKLETRKNGKVVVISNIEGDRNVLLSELKRALGAGGVARPEYIEINGNNEKLVCNFLLRHSDHLVGVKKEPISEKQQEEINKKTKKIEGKKSLDAKAAPSMLKKTAIEIEADAAIPDVKTIKSMKPPEIKAHLLAKGLSIQGNKKELMARLVSLTK